MDKPQWNSASQVTTVVPVGPEAQRMNCAFCNSPIISRVEYNSTTATHLIAVVICVFVGFCGCCLIPYCKLFDNQRFRIKFVSYRHELMQGRKSLLPTM